MEVFSTSVLAMILAKREKETSVSTLNVKPLFCVSFHQVINTIERLPDCMLFYPVLISVDEYTKNWFYYGNQEFSIAYRKRVYLLNSKHILHSSFCPFFTYICIRMNDFNYHSDYSKIRSVKKKIAN